MATGIAIISGTGALLWWARRQIQGYWFDRRCPAADRDLTGKVALVTGANQGLGKALAVELARLGASVVLGCRSQARAEAAAREIAAQTGSRKVSILSLDLSSQASIRAAAADFQLRHPSLDFLVLNAGIGSGNPGLVWQTNHLGPFELVELLAPHIEATAKSSADGVRIVAVASGAHSRATIDFEQPFEPQACGLTGAYGQSKLAQIMHMKRLTQRASDKGLAGKLVAVSCTPGFVRTALIPLSGVLSWLLWPLVLLMSRGPRSGAEVLKLCCIGQVTPGGYYSNCWEKPATGTDGIATDAAAQQRLWEVSERLVLEGRFP